MTVCDLRLLLEGLDLSLEIFFVEDFDDASSSDFNLVEGVVVKGDSLVFTTERPGPINVLWPKPKEAKS